MVHSKVYLVMAVLLVACLSAGECQLTFSTSDWPNTKRSGVGPANAFYADEEPNCKTSLDTMLVIYRLIQTEVHRVVACREENLN